MLGELLRTERLHAITYQLRPECKFHYGRAAPRRADTMRTMHAHDMIVTCRRASSRQRHADAPIPALVWPRRRRRRRRHRARCRPQGDKTACILILHGDGTALGAVSAPPARRLPLLPLNDL